MKNENEFNKKVTAQLKLLGTSYKAIKTSDRFQIGVSDWIIFHDGKAVAIESKFSKNPPENGKLLKHPITGPQLMFMESMERAGVRCYALIGISYKDGLDCAVLVPYHIISELDGNPKTVSGRLDDKYGMIFTDPKYIADRISELF